MSALLEASAYSEMMVFVVCSCDMQSRPVPVW